MIGAKKRSGGIGTGGHRRRPRILDRYAPRSKNGSGRRRRLRSRPESRRAILRTRTNYANCRRLPYSAASIWHRPDAKFRIKRGRGKSTRCAAKMRLCRRKSSTKSSTLDGKSACAAAGCTPFPANPQLIGGNLDHDDIADADRDRHGSA